MAGGLAALLPGVGNAQEAGANPGPASDIQRESWQALGQATGVWQRKPPFGAAYDGPNSLRADRERSYSYTATAFIGARPWRGGEFYLNPEVAAGLPLSNLTGVGGFPNGELARTSGRDPVLYLARAFWRQTIGFGGGGETIESAPNQMADVVDRRRLVVTAGVVSLIDIFDRNAYSHDPRTQFMNWALITHGSFDFAADARGYTRGGAVEWIDEGWALRAGRFAMARESNGLPLNPALGRSHGDQVEFESSTMLAGQRGTWRALFWRNRAVMGRYDDAIAAAAATGGDPAVADVRRDQRKWGWGLSIEQALGRWGGFFARYGRGPDRAETYSYTEIGRSASAGLLIDGSLWGRGEDRLGVGVAENALSTAHRNYLALGGLGFFLGDGKLDYRPERLLEVFYSLRAWRGLWLSADFQRIVNPGYNAARGPVSVYGVRMHTEF